MRRRVSCSRVVADEWILVVRESAEVRVVAPGLLDELELAADAGIHAEEMNTACLSVVFERQDGVASAWTGIVAKKRWVEGGRAEDPRRAAGAGGPPPYGATAPKDTA